MKTALKIVGSLLVLLLLLAGGFLLWASSASNRILSATYLAHAEEFPIPFPLDADELTEQELDAETAERLALDQAVDRGRHLANVRYMCTECHSSNLAGGTMVDAFPIGTLLGPNLTGGAGSRTLEYSAVDWDRAIRHGILPDGRASVMPAEDFQLMSDQELSDIVAYVQSLPPVDNVVPAPAFGPLGKVLLATGQLQPSVLLIESHDAPHRLLPPPAGVTLEFGAHLAGTCTGCHSHDFSGGPITGGDPSWPPARNLTPHPSALEGWSYAEFVAAMREGVRPDGTSLQVPMTFVTPYAQQMTDVEMEAIWTYLRSLPPVETGG